MTKRTQLAAPPTLRRERKIPFLTLFFPVTATTGNIGVYRLDDRGFRLIRCFGPCTVHAKEDI
jgi:hypothetical protein